MRLHFSAVARPAPAPQRIASSILMGAALVLGVVGCPPVPPDDSDAGVGGSAMGGSAAGGVVTGGTTSTGGAGGESGSAGSAGAGTSACSVPEQSAQPFTTTFRFTNPGPDPRWLFSTCLAQIQFDLTSCSDGYQRRINVIAAPSCYAICPTCQYFSCECALTDTGPIAAGNYRDVAWNGDDPVRDTIPTDSSMPCPCTRLPNAPAGLYRISVPVGVSASTGPAYTVTRDFTLDHAGGIVEIRL
jgi:hypothetical protein